MFAKNKFYLIYHSSLTYLRACIAWSLSLRYEISYLSLKVGLKIQPLDTNRFALLNHSERLRF